MNVIIYGLDWQIIYRVLCVIGGKDADTQNCDFIASCETIAQCMWACISIDYVSKSFCVFNPAKPPNGKRCCYEIS